MGRKRKNAVYAFFSFDKERKVSTCQVSGCAGVIKGEHGTNLLYHLSSNHPDEFKIVNERNKINKESEKNKENNNSAANTSTVTGEDVVPGTKIDYLKTQCVNLVTVHGRPFSFLNDLAFRNILSMISINPRQIQSINAHSITKYVTQAAEKKRTDIGNDLKGRMISLKVDSATRLDRSFFGVNAQYIENGSIKIINLGITELYARSTADYLKEKLLYILRKFYIEVGQIYSITTDNGANMLKMARLLNDVSEDDETHENDGSQDALLNILLNERDIDNAEINVISIRCAAHTLQLAVTDALQEDDSIHLINEARNIARKLRTPTMRNILKAAKEKHAILDVTTRWHSTLDMLERLLELKDYCSETPGEVLYVASTTWSAFSDLTECLKPAKVLTKLLQEEQLTIGDFYFHWLRCYLETSHVQVPLAQLICKHMKSREAVLMTNPTFVSALYLDPRFRVVLSAEEEELAKNHLKETWKQILKLDAKKTDTGVPVTDISSPDDQNASTSQSSPNVRDEIESILSQTEELKRRDQRDYYVQTRANITAILDNFSRHPRLETNKDVLLFWESQAFSEPQLYRLAKTVLATPATQVSVERLFSSLKFVLNDLRYNLNEDIVEDILLLRNNQLK